MQKLKIETIYPFVARNQIKNIIVFGCGGTGSYVIPNIARLLSTINPEERQVPKLTVIDGDKVEEKNLIRQNFVYHDVGKNKADVMASRYSGAFGIEISAIDKYVDKENDIVNLIDYDSTLILSCVDNIRTRLNIKKALEKSYIECIWVDSGNEEKTGQVIVSSNGRYFYEDSYLGEAGFPIMDVFDHFPELVERAKETKEQSQLSCAELAESSPQYGFINATAATIMCNFAFDLINKNKIKVCRTDFSIENKFSHVSLTKDVVKTVLLKRFDEDSVERMF